MALFKCGKVCVDNVASVKIVGESDGFYAFLSIVANNENLGIEKVKLPIRKDTEPRVEMNGNILQRLSCYRPIIFGDVDSAVVGNVGYVEGFIIDYKSPRGSYTVNKQYKCCYGEEARLRSKLPLTSKKGATIIHIEGDMFVLECDFPMELVVMGNVFYAEGSNTFNMKGIAKNIQVGNMLYCTVGESEAPSYSQLKKNAAERSKRVDEAVNSMFADLKGNDAFGDMFTRGSMFNRQ